MKKETKIHSPSGGTIFRFITRMYLSYALLALILVLFLHLLFTSSPETQRNYLGVQILSAFKGQAVDIEYVEQNLLHLDQTDPQLIRYTRIRHLSPPTNLPYNFGAYGVSKTEMSEWVIKFFRNMTNGRFIEAGANEGVFGSHTMWLEKEMNWTGLLVECNPKIVPHLKTHHRNAWVADVCLAPSPTPGILNFSNPTNWTYSGTMKKPWNIPVSTKWEFFEVQTIPLYTLLAALDYTSIDYFNFDVEGVELAVLKTFPFDLIIFKVIIIEIYFYTAEEKKELHELLTSNGYIFAKDISIDKIYVHNSVKHLLEQ
ncbi:Protein Star [Orchesella cincta]|uniref:Protein Star n=1 Tax=Orchesella cincta TaxID=48709 RepID=A0A1D2M9I2_ORCCI|nr:Protein Star [Orchesella cincta]